MATQAEILAVREYIDELDDSRGWDDARIGRFVDATVNDYLAAAEIWVVKAGSYTELVNVNESGSSRSLDTLQAKAFRMADHYRKLGATEVGIVDNASAPFVVPIRRG